MPPVVLLGPQRYQPTLAQAFQRVSAEGPVAAVTAGWEEREDEIDELSSHLGHEIVNLRLHARTEQIFERDPEFLAAWRRRRVRLRHARELYRVRLRHLIGALERLPDPSADPLMGDLDEQAREDAFQQIRHLDAGALARVQELHAEFEEAVRPAERESVVLQRKSVAELLGDCRSVAFAGGHVAVLRNRLRLFDIGSQIGERPLFAWSAGAMCACERIAIYHENAPQGPGLPLMLEHGLGLCPGVIALPHASSRMRLENRENVALFARRFAPRACVALDDASGLIWGGATVGWTLFGDGARRLRTDGRVTDLSEVPGVTGAAGGNT